MSLQLKTEQTMYCLIYSVHPTLVKKNSLNKFSATISVRR